VTENSPKPMRFFRVRTASLFAAVLGVGFGSSLHADIPVPARLMQPATAAEAWDVIRLATANLDRLFAENRVEEVKDQAVLLSPSLRFLAREGALDGRQAEADAIASESFGFVNLLVRESMSGNLDGAGNVFSLLVRSVGRLGESFDPALRTVEIYSCVDHPEMAEAWSGQKCVECGKELRPRCFPYSVIHVAPGPPTLKLEMETPTPLEAGRESEVRFRLTTLDGDPVTESDLVLAHAGRVHLLLVDETGADFHHLVPQPGNDPGVYEASIVPACPFAYRALVFVIPAATRLPESLSAMLPGKEVSEIAPVGHPSGRVGMVAESDGLSVRLLFPGPARLTAGKTQLVQIHVTGSDGQPVTTLEPFRNAFAHLTLLEKDFGSAYQVHPLGGEILREDLRGGPTLSFKLHPPGPGIWRLYCQLRVDGRVRTFPFALQVGE